MLPRGSGVGGRARHLLVQLCELRRQPRELIEVGDPGAGRLRRSDPGLKVVDLANSSSRCLCRGRPRLEVIDLDDPAGCRLGGSDACLQLIDLDATCPAGLGRCCDLRLQCVELRQTVARRRRPASRSWRCCEPSVASCWASSDRISASSGRNAATSAGSALGFFLNSPMWCGSLRRLRSEGVFATVTVLLRRGVEQLGSSSGS